ncbi:MAG TPA: DMT family transporter [Gaiellaceae bacterium]|nr:DMT family transporter [Gaiellaceae bacterium]
MSSDNRPTTAQLSLALVVVVWAGAFAAIKALLDHGTSAQDVAVLRYLVAAPGFAVVLWLARGLPGLGRGDLLRIVGAGVLVVAGYHLSLNVGQRYTTAGTAALVVALAPSLTLGLSVALGLERLTARRTTGLAVAFAGVAVVILLGAGEELSLENARGPVIVLGAPLAFALYNVLLRPLLGRYGVLPLTAATSLVGTLALLPLARPSTVEGLATMSAGDLALVLYLGVVCTLLGYVGWNVGLRGLGPTGAVSYAYGIPPLAVVIGALTLDEPVTTWLVAGGILVVAGVALAQRPATRDRTVQVASGPTLARD